jgi:hypothetical protein
MTWRAISARPSDKNPLVKLLNKCVDILPAGPHEGPCTADLVQTLTPYLGAPHLHPPSPPQKRYPAPRPALSLPHCPIPASLTNAHIFSDVDVASFFLPSKKPSPLFSHALRRVQTTWSRNTWS